MIYKEIDDGDLLSAKQGLILHGCNAQGVMGSGVAKAVRETYPLVYDSYIAWKKRRNSSLPLGYVQFVTINEHLTVGNAITQEFYGNDGQRYASYFAIECAFKLARDWMRDMSVKTLHIPKIGSGLGGADWNIISQSIKHVFQDTDLEVIVH